MLAGKYVFVFKKYALVDFLWQAQNMLTIANTWVY